MSEKRKKIVSLLLVFSLVALSGNLMAQASKGAKLRIQINNGQEVTGELIAVKKDSLLLLNKEINTDITVPIKDVKEITIEKKSWGYNLGVLGTLAGILYGSEKTKTDGKLKSQSYYLTGAIGGVAGAVLGTFLGINKRIQIQGKSETEIQEILEKLNKKAQVPNFQ